MKTLNKNTGRLGEEMAERLLKQKGYQIVKKNFSTRFGEIDLICSDGDTLVFVEVKTKRGLAFGSPEDMFTPSKAGKVRRMATIYLDGKDVPCRIDVVAVVLGENNEPVRITHYPNAGM